VRFICVTYVKSFGQKLAVLIIYVVNSITLLQESPTTVQASLFQKLSHATTQHSNSVIIIIIIVSIIISLLASLRPESQIENDMQII